MHREQETPFPQLQCPCYQDTAGASPEEAASQPKRAVTLATATCRNPLRAAACSDVERRSPHVAEAWQQDPERMQQLALHPPVLIGFNECDLSKLANFWAVLDFIQQRLQTAVGPAMPSMQPRRKHTCSDIHQE